MSGAFEGVEKVFSELPHAYLSAPVHADTWEPETQTPLITYLSQENEMADTALDAGLSSRELSTLEEPDDVVIVLYEGFDEAAIQTASTPPDLPNCSDAGDHNKKYTQTFTAVDRAGRNVNEIEKYNSIPGWVIYDGDISVDRRFQAGASWSLVSTGEEFLTLSELKEVYDVNMEFAGGLEDEKAEAEAAVKALYEQFIKYSTEKVDEQTFVLKWYPGNRWSLLNAKIKVGVTIHQYCNNTDATSTTKTNTRFRSEVSRVAGVQDGKLTLQVSPSSVQASLSVRGNGQTHSAYSGKTLTLSPGAYTITETGYDTMTGEYYTTSGQTVSVAAGSDKTAHTYMYPQPR